LPFLISLQSSAPISDLHSFPTRRSSDLPSTTRAARRRIAAVRGGGRLQDGRASRPQPGSDRAHDRPALLLRGSARQDRLGRRTPDRKSTRLNSSHVSISYAVFCLKKKKK